MLKNIRSFIVAGIVALSVVSPAVAQTNIKVSATPNIFAPMFRALVASFEARNPDIKVSLDIPPGEQELMITDILRRAMINDLPDVSFQGYNYLRTLAERGIALPLESLIASEADWGKDFAPSVTSAAKVDDSIRGLGVGLSFPVLYYNVDLVQKVLGAGAPFPRTWPEIFDLAVKIGQAQPGVLGGFHTAHPWMFQGNIEAVGGRMMSADGKSLTFAGSEGLEAMRTLRRFGEAGQARAQMSREQARQAFVGGALGIFTDSSSVLSSHEQQISGRFSLGVAPYPRMEGIGRIPAAGVASVLMTRDQKRQSTAWRFMKFVASAEGQEVVIANTAYVPANSAALSAPRIAEHFAKNPKMRTALELVPHASAWFAFPGANGPKIDKAIQDAMESVLLLKATPEVALEELRRQVQSLL